MFQQTSGNGAAIVASLKSTEVARHGLLRPSECGTTVLVRSFER